MPHTFKSGLNSSYLAAALGLITRVVILGAWTGIAEAAPPVPAAVESRGVLTLAPEVKVFRLAYGEKQTELGPEHEGTLKEIGGRLERFDGRVLIEAFADPQARDPETVRLSAQRVKVVEDYLRRFMATSPATFLTVIHGGRFLREAPRPDVARQNVVLVALLAPEVASEVTASICEARVAIGDQCREASRQWFVAPKQERPAPPAPAKPAAKPAAPPVAKAPKAAPSTPSSPKSPGFNRLGMRVLYIYAPTQPATFNRLAYSGPGPGTSEHTQTSGSAGAAPKGGGLEMQFPLNPRVSMATGARYRRYADFVGEATFEPSGDDHGVESKTTASAVGGWIDFYALNKVVLSGLNASAGSGLDFDYSTVQIDESYYDDRIAAAPADSDSKVLSRLGVASLRLVSRLTYGTRWLQAGFNVNFQLPVWNTGAKVQADDDADAWKKDLAHRPAIGSELAAGVLYQF